MTDLLTRHDPAAELEIDSAALRAMVDEKLGLTMGLAQPGHRRPAWRRWVPLAAGFVAVAVLFFPALSHDPGAGTLDVRAFARLPGVEAVIEDTPGAGGGVRTHAVDGESIWVMGALSHQLNRIDPGHNRVIDSYTIDEAVEGVVSGGGYLWLHSYDNGGEILRFDPAAGVVDLKVPLPGLVGRLAWWDDHLFVSDDNNVVSQISVDGTLNQAGPGRVLYNGPERMWLGLPQEDGSTLLMSSAGNTATFPGEIAEITEAGGYLWVVDTQHRLNRVEVDGEGLEGVDGGISPRALTEHDGYLWYVDFEADTLTKVDMEEAEVVGVTPLGGRPGDLFSADGSLFVSLYQPGLLLRFDTEAEMTSVGETVVDEVIDGYRLFCTGGGPGPTVVLDPEGWLGPGMWSVVQARLSEDALVCTHGRIGDTDYLEKNANLVTALQSHRIPGPYVLVSVFDAADSTRLLANSLDDVVAVVMIDPRPPGYFEWLQSHQPDRLENSPIRPTPDLGRAADLGDIPLTVVRHDFDLTFRSGGAAAAFGSEENRASFEQMWLAGVEFYMGLSSNATQVVADDAFAGFQVVWQRPDLVVDVVREKLNGVG